MNRKQQNNVERITSDRKPFRDRTYFLHVKSEEEKLTKKIKKFGGSVAHVFDNVYAIITDDGYAKMYLKRHEQNCSKFAATASSSTANNRESTCTPPLNQHQTDSAYGTLSSSSRPPLTKSLSVSATTSTAESQNATKKPSTQDKCFSKMPSILRQAVEQNVKVMTKDEFLCIVDGFEENFYQRRQKLLSAPQKKDDERPKCNVLTAPFFKFEDTQRLYCPVYKQFAKWPTIYIRPGGKGTPFESRILDEIDDGTDVDEEKQKNSGNNALKSRKVGRKTTKPRQQRKKIHDPSGYCDLCHCFAENIEDHIKSEFHQKSAQSDEIYAELDALINEGPSLDDFVLSLLTQSAEQCSSTSRSSSVYPCMETLNEENYLDQTLENVSRPRTPPLERNGADFVDSEFKKSPIFVRRPRYCNKSSEKRVLLSASRRCKRRKRVIIEEEDSSASSIL